MLVGYLDLMKTPTKERFAAALAKTIYADIASPVGQAFEKAAELFRGLRVVPTMEVDPSDGTLRFSFQAGRRKSDIDETIERLLELLGELAAERKRRVVIVFDEFQEILALDKRFPNLMRAVFQAQPEVSHVYLGSKRHLLERIFSDKNEPFWRSAKQLEVGMISPTAFEPFLRQRFEETGKRLSDEAAARLLASTGGHPYATQELAYFVWELVPDGERGIGRGRGGRRSAASCAPSTTTSCTCGTTRRGPQRLLMLALADEPTCAPCTPPTTTRGTSCPPTPTLQTGPERPRAEGDRRRREATASTESSSRSSPSGCGARRRAASCIGEICLRHHGLGDGWRVS